MDTPKGRASILKKARKRAKLTQAQVAEQVGIAANHYAMLERGEANTTTPTLRKLEAVLDVKLLKL